MEIKYLYKGIKICLFIVLASFWQMAFSQCLPPTAVETTSTNSTCLSNGSINVTSVSGGSTENYEVALYSQDNLNLVKPWQSGTLLDNIGSGTYTLRVRVVCDPGISTVYTKQVIVGGNYVQPNVSNITVNRHSQCNDGKITVIGSGGQGQYTFALVPTLNEPEPVANYIVSPSSSRTFENLPAGTYYVRIYDECGSFSTRTATINSITTADPFTATNMYLEYFPCDSIAYRFDNLTRDFGTFQSNTVDKNKRFWIIHPNGTLDTLESFNNTLGSISFRAKFHVSKMGNYGTGLFPGTSGGIWPKNYTIGYKDACGNVYTHTYTIQKPEFEWDIAKSLGSDNNNTCSEEDYYIRYRLMGTAPGFRFVRLTDTQVSISKNGGTTWENVSTVFSTNGDYVSTFTLTRNSSLNICLRICGIASCKPFTVPAIGPISVSGWESSLHSCPGLSGYHISSVNDAIFPVSVQMISGPTGQSFVPFSYESFSTLLNAQSKMLTDLLPGSYTFRLTDACGRITNLNFNLSNPRQQIVVDEIVSNCASGNLEISSRGSGYWVNNYNSISNRNLTRVSILNLDNTNAIGTVSYSATGDGLNFIHSIPFSILNSNLQIGKTYKVRVYSTGAGGDAFTSCNFAETTFTWSGGGIDLSNSLAVICPPSTLGTIAAVASGGTGYTYSLYANSVDPSNLLRGPQSSNFFNNVPIGNFVLTAQDDCGRGTQKNISFDATSSLPIFYSSTTHPCPGSVFTISSITIPGASYRWFKDGNLITGATDSKLILSSVKLEDAGVYTVEATINSCQVSQSSLEINPSKCDEPLPVTLTYLSGSYNEGLVTLSWATADEINSSKFEVQKSIDGYLWNYLGEIAAHGESSTLQKYHFVDSEPVHGKSYYRLKMIDKNYSYEYSRAISIEIGDQNINDLLTEIFPNPATDILEIKSSDWNEITQLEVLDQTGQIILNVSEPKDPKLKVTGLKSGVYILRIIKRSGESAVNRFVIVR